MTIVQFRNMLAQEIDELSCRESDALMPKERIKGLQIAYNLAEKLYETYGGNPANVKQPYMTNRQLAEILAKSYGQVMFLPYDDYNDENFSSSFETVWPYFDEKNDDDNREVPENVRIRRWGSDNWVEPTVEVYEEFTQGLPYPFYTEDTSSNSKKKVIY